MSLAVSAFSIFDPELARMVRVLHDASARLARIERQHPPDSLDYQIARLGFKQALKAVAAYAIQGRRGMSWTIADERRVLSALPPGQVRAVRKARERAVELIRERGWTQGQEVGGPNGGYCISGGLYAAAWELERGIWERQRVCMTKSVGCSGSGIAEFAKRVILQELGLAWQPDGPCPLRVWNDQPGRRLDDVLAALAGPVEVGGLPTLLWVLAAATGVCRDEGVES